MKKNYSKTGRVCRVTFELQSDAAKVSLCGDFNNWDPMANVLKRRKDGLFSTTISLEAGKSYRFRYVLDDGSWENDWNADQYLPNEFGSEDSIINL